MDILFRSRECQNVVQLVDFVLVQFWDMTPIAKPRGVNSRCIWEEAIAPKSPLDTSIRSKPGFCLSKAVSSQGPGLSTAPNMYAQGYSLFMIVCTW